jgi:hypothetical protein
MACTCTSPDVVVDYDHPHGLIRNVPVQELRRSDPSQTRPVMELRGARCATCGASLDGQQLGARLQPGGDLFDPRFRWLW